MTALNNAPTGNAYTLATTVTAPGATRLTLHVRNAAIYYQLGRGWPAVVWGDEVFLPPGTAGLDRVFDAVRIRSGALDTPAQVTIDAVTAQEAGDG